MQSALQLRGLTKAYSSGKGREDDCLAVDNVGLDVGENEFLAMVGPSGCGKSTILRLIAGLEQPTSGQILVNGERVDDVPPRARQLGFMFQGYALFKHMTVTQNIGFGLKIKKTPKGQQWDRISQLISLMGLEGLEDRKPSQLSGGQQQRVALARALAPQPRLLLLDEPFGAVDAKVRQKLRADTKRWQRELKIPTILVTHDQREALELGDRVAVMNQGRFEQIDTSPNVYDRPAIEFVARFIGRVNVFHTELSDGYSKLVKSSQFQVMVRPEDIAVFSSSGIANSQYSTIPGNIVNRSFLGRTVRMEVKLGGGQLVTVAMPKHEAVSSQLDLGDAVSLEVRSCQVFPCTTGFSDGDKG